MDEFNPVDEEHGILTVEVIKEVCKRIFEEYPVKYCYWFRDYSVDVKRRYPWIEKK